MKIAVLLTCYNRKTITEKCLNSFYLNIKDIEELEYDIYLVDDNSSDGTAELIKNKYPKVKLIAGTGSLFWAGGMRLAWKTALESGNNYDGFLLINDDVEFIESFFEKIIKTNQWSLKNYQKEGAYVLSVKDKKTNEWSYGGHEIKNKIFKYKTDPVYPSNDVPLICQVSNANILYVSSTVVEKIGIFDNRYTHSIADYDYSLTVSENQLPLLVCPGYGGYCTNDHVSKELLIPLSLKDRIKKLYDIKSFSLNEHLYYLRKHFGRRVLYVPYAFIINWLQALFPKLIQWEIIVKKNDRKKP